MKTKNILRASLMIGVLLAVSSCKEDNYYIIDPNAIPQASDYNIKVEVDQETNQVSLSITDAAGNAPKGVYPVWKVYTKTNPVISTRPVYTDIIGAAGDYDVEMQVGNRNGISDGVKTTSIHIENTLMDFTPYIRNLTDNSSKVWQMAANEPKHLACGTPWTDGTDWWSAQPYEKADFGIYDNRMTFTDNGGKGTGLYTFDPGAAGTVYINTGVNNLPPYSDAWQDVDYCAPVDIQKDVPFTLTVEGVDLYLVLPEGTFMAYLPNVDQYNNPKWKVNSITKNKIELTCSNNDIAWHYILQPEGADAADKPFEGFKYDSEFNLWKDADVHLNSTWFADGGWGLLPNQPEVEVTNESIKLHTPAEMGNDKWQGQVHIGTNIVLSSTSTYDFSIKVTANVDSKVTIKPHLDGDDGVFFTEETVAFDAGGSYFYLTDVPGWEGPVVLTLDFGGNPDIDFEISKVVIKDHANDDGTVLPSESPETPGEQNVSWVDVNSPDNLFNGCEYEISYYYAPGWSQIDNPETVIDGNSFTLTLPEATTDQWQNQFALHTNISTSAEKNYDFRVTFYSDQDLPGVTFKCVLDGGGDNDNIFYMAERVAVSAYEEVTYTWVNCPGIDMDKMAVFFDFGGNPANTHIIAKDIIIQEHRDAPGEPTANWVDVNSADNLFSSCNYTTWYYYAPGWAQIADPDTQIEGNSFTLTLTEATSDQWQAQFALHTDISTSADKNYDFRVTFYSNQPLGGVTYKCVLSGGGENDNIFYMADRVEVPDYEEVTYQWVNCPGIDMDKLSVFFDFGGNPAGTVITAKDIIIQEHR